MNRVGSHLPHRTVAVIACGVIGLAIVGLIVGVNNGVPRHDDEPAATALLDEATADGLSSDVQRVDHAANTPRPASSLVASHTETVIPAASYAEMRRLETGPTSQWKPSLEQLHLESDFQRCITCHNPHTAEITPNPTDKLRSLATRASRRAFNGAPPVIPHAIEQTNDAACYACHGHGAKIGERVANRMSHGFLVNCLQCHGAPPPTPFADVNTAVSSSFVGLPAPVSAPRAFPDAPPVVPHSTWMREQCLSCHGGAWPGLEVTHRWRANCQQCHALSASSEQGVTVDSSINRHSLAVGK
ncbi:MAG: hypothetical protein KDB00_03395 [Planctomycetales bacterium]|nr:hypothetical protein [Planctomycetales bacterium]